MRRFTGTEATKHHYYRVRAAVLAYLGGKCVVCGFDDPRALQVDHIEGGGGKALRQHGPTAEYKAVLAGKPGYQLLCANHNWIKRCERKEYGR